VADLPGVLHVLQGTEALGQRHVGVDPVELVELDAVDAQAAEAHLDALAQEAGPPDRLPLPR
jgi:hypothetical protein